MTDGFQLHVRDRHTLLRIAAGALASDGVALCLEGDLSHHQFPGELRPQFGPSGVFRRNTVWPVQGFVVLPLDPTSARRTLRAALPGGHLPCGVLHVLIGRPDEILFAANDRFEPGGVFVVAAFPQSLLDVLVTCGTLWSYSRVPA